jgi:carbohydrate-selective porin OprB
LICASPNRPSSEAPPVIACTAGRQCFSFVRTVFVSPGLKRNQFYDMKKLIAPVALALTATMFLSGCVAAVGNRSASPSNATVGQQLIDLQKAKETGALTEAEYQAQKAKLLENK